MDHTHIIKQQRSHQNVKNHAYFIHLIIKKFVHKYVKVIINM